MTRILLVSPVPTHPTTAGNRARIATLMQALSDAGHTVYLLHVTREAGDETAMRNCWGERYLRFDYRNPETAWQRRRRRWWGRLGSERAYLHDLDSWYDPQLDTAVQDAIATHQIDALLVTYVFFSKALLAAPDGVNRLLDTHDLFGNRHRRFLDAGLTPAWFSCTPQDERRGLNRADTVIAIQDAEREQLASLTERPVVTVGHLIHCEPQTAPYPADLQILSVGSANSINVESLLWFLTEVLPKVRAQQPNATLSVVGTVCKDPEVQAAVARQAPGSVSLAGIVDDLAASYRSAQVVINPMQTGTGLKIKSVEALGHGRALVTAPAGAAGLEDGAGNAFLSAGSADEFAAAVADLLQFPDRAATIATEGVKFAQRYNAMCLQALTRTL